MNPYQIVSEVLDNLRNKDSKVNKAIRRTALVGGTVAAGHGMYRGKQEYDRMRIVFINLQNEILNRDGQKGLQMWKEFKKTSQYKVRRNQAALNILKHGAISAAVAFLLYGFYAWMKHHKIEKDLPKSDFRK